MTMNERAMVGNAADREQIRRADRKARTRREQERRDLAGVLKTEPGRRVMWRFLRHCRVLQSIWEPSAKIHYNAGMQDVGHWLMAEIEQAEPEALATMRMEALRAEMQESKESEALNMRPSADVEAD